MSGGNQRGVVVPVGSGPVEDATVGFAVDLVERSGVCGPLRAALDKTTGRPRSVSVTSVLVGLLLLAMDDRPLFLSAVCDLLYRRLSVTQRAGLGMAGSVTDAQGFLAAYRRVRYCFGLICSVVDPSPLPKNRCVPNEDLAVLSRPMTETEAGSQRAKLESLINALVEASVSLLTETERAAFDGSVGLDATAMALWSRGPSKRTGRSASDPDGGWYVREGDHRDEAGPTGSKWTRIAWALESTLVTMAPSPGAVPTYPNLVLGFALSRPGEDPGGTGARVLASVVERGQVPGFLGADRAYSAALPERFHLPVKALGYSLVMDYRIDQLGLQANSGGAVLVEGTWYCPSIPASLVAATVDYRAGVIDEERWKARIDARSPYALKRKDRPDADGYERLTCPALGDHPGLMCPLREASLTPRDGRMKVLDPPADPPKLCRQSAITIAPDVGVRHRQALAFGTEAWARRYATLRNTIEGTNGYLKDPAHQALSQPGRRRVRGIAAQSIFCAFLVMAANLRKIRAFRALVAAGKANQVAVRARRRRVNLGDFLPATG
jgi:hypothetical protein